MNPVLANRTRQGNTRSGFQLADLAISTAILLVITGSFVKSLNSMGAATRSESTVSNMTLSSNGVLRRIIDEVKFSGFATVDGLDYPYLFNDGVPNADFKRHGHEAPIIVAEKYFEEASATKSEYASGEPAQISTAEVCREVVFLLPADADGDGVPDLDAFGEASWSTNEISIVLVPDGESNRIERRVDGVLDEVLARNVESMFFDTPETSGFQVPLGCLRIQVEISELDPEGNRIRHELESIVRLRNGGI